MTVAGSSNMALEMSAGIHRRSRPPSPCYPADTIYRYSGDDEADITGSQSSIFSALNASHMPSPLCAEPLHEAAPPPHECAMPDLDGRSSHFANPASPLDIQGSRYTHRAKIPSMFTGGVTTLEPMEMDFERIGSIGSGWTAHKHPEGQVYFKNTSQMACTDAWLHDQEILEKIDNITTHLREQVNRRNVPADTEIVVHIQCTDDDDFKYYLASASKRAVFWLESVDVTLLSGNIEVHDKSHLWNAQKMQYWIHVEMFPDGYKEIDTVVGEIVGDLLYQAFDSKTSATSTIAREYEDLVGLLHLVKEVRTTLRHAGSILIIARNMYTIHYERFLNFHGERTARLESHVSVYETDSTRYQRSLGFLFMSPLLLYLPEHYLSQIERIWTDHLISYRTWKVFITGLQRDWENSLTPITVLLTANVGFLAIQSVDSQTSYRSPAQIASYASTILSIGSLLLCTILSRHHRITTHKTAHLAASYLRKRQDRLGGLPLLAITFSLPSALFSWGMLAFFVSICWVCFHDTEPFTIITTAIVFSFVAALLILVVIMDWEPTDSDTFTTRLKEILRDSAFRTGRAKAYSGIERCILAIQDRWVPWRRIRRRNSDRGILPSHH